MKARTLGSAEGAHRTHCVRRRRQAPTLQGKGLGVLCVMHGPFHTEDAESAENERIPVASELVSDVACREAIVSSPLARFA